MKIYITAFLTLLFGSVAFGQQELTLHFMDIQQRTHTNPAYFNKKTVNFSLPSLYVGGANTGFSYKDLIRTDASGGKTVDVENLLTTLKSTNYLRAQAQVDAFNLSVRFKDLQIGITADVKTNNYFNYPKSLLDFAWNGNAKFIGETIEISPDFESTTYTEVGLSLAKNFSDGKLYVGGRIKLLSGIANANVMGGSFSLYTNPEIYQLEVATDYSFQTSNIDPEEGLIMDNPGLFTKNRGFAADLGIIYKPIEKLSLAGSIVDFGSITWREHTTTYTGNGSFTFNGIDAEGYAFEDSFDIEDEIKVFTDSVRNEFETTEDDAPYSTRLPGKVYLSATFSPIKSLRLGGLYFHEFYRNQSFRSITLSGTKDFGKFLTAGLTYSIRNKRADNIGGHLTIKGGPVWLFIASDNALAFINPKSARNTNLRVGLNIVL